MPIYNPYTETNDMPVIEDFLPKSESFLTYGQPIPLSQLSMTERPIVLSNYAIAFGQWANKYGVPQSAIDEYDKIRNERVANATAAMSELEQNDFWKRMAAKYKQLTSNVSGVVSNVTQGVSISLLAPFRYLMTKSLAKKGYIVKSLDSLSKVAVLFNDLVIMNKQHYDLRNYERYNLEHADAPAKEGIDPEVIKAIVSAFPPDQLAKLAKNVLDYIKNLINKKRNGEQLTPDEAAIVEQAENPTVETEGVSPVIKILGVVAILAIVTKLLKIW